MVVEVTHRKKICRISATVHVYLLQGMYCMSMNYIEMAEKHLQIAAEKSKSNEQFVTNMLNLAMVYMHSFQMHNGRMPHFKQEVTVL